MIKNRIGFKIALIINCALFIILMAGALFIYKQETAVIKRSLQDKGRLASIIGAKGVSRIIEEAVDNGVLSLADVLDTEYIEIQGFDPPKYHTKYDWYLDKAILSFEDDFLKESDILYAVAMDINGYVPTHNTRYNKPPTGDREKDLTGNRSKRIYKDPIAKNAGANEQAVGLMQVYSRDTGEMVWDISTPVFVKGKHWGCFRIGFDLETVNKLEKNLMLYLGSIMLITILFIMIITFALINKALAPLVEFTKIASELADGNVDTKIESKTQDEIGRLADVLERLRISLKAAMERLSRR
ncbi:HAMP domain-containing protein [Desulfonema limicola]|uniref:histidine kinase n=1 Tax=Desulfonema limicola TaxID=45656 RepID=A0A975BED1_9BACT|nr:HAMP domain-containing protein [Desulfonema limicola]QTA83604.1 HAMP domain-containing protein [Desulfonema limicola]